ncbi:DEAD/DEAH box helicase [Caballeronia sp. 15711]|uniref:DEAD/DEAH box helicase n=1 Tax=Caballeronia sp. 15711 TaxID=3391029 RepID=UPI0039E3A714
MKKNIAELEELFALASDDHALQGLLRDELNHRNTGRAAALLQRVETSLQKRAAPERHNGKMVVADNEDTDANRAKRVDPPPARKVDQTSNLDTRVVPKVVPLTPNDPASILASWIAIEALTPQTYRRPADLVNGDQRRIVMLDRGELPWTKGERSKPNYQLFYQLVLGCVTMDKATQKLVEVFGETEERSGREGEKAAIAAVLLDKNGCLLEEKAVAVSSFAWALPVALESNFQRMGEWTDVEPRLVDGLTKHLQRHDRDGKPLPVTREVAAEACQWLVQTLKLPADLVEAPTFAIRVYHYYKSRSAPEVELLNSFFLADLGRAANRIAAGQANEALARFLGQQPVDQGPDLLTDRAALEALLAPGRTPAARWPSPGGHPLVTLQQAAVNGIRHTLAGTGRGIVAVNGPPGTGKTTLLRDIVAGCVMDRAIAMAAFDDPVAAFSASGQKVAAGDRAFYHLYRVAESLRGHEVLVASSNNKAVENVSKELPSKKAVGRDISYLRTVSDRLQARRSETGEVTDGEPTWGLIAAVLGNVTNRNAFQQAVWWDDDKSLRLYLKAAKGDAVVREKRDEDGNVVSRETPSVVAAEKPPTPEVAIKEWQKARRLFTALHASLLEELAALERVRKLCIELATARKKLSAAHADRDVASSVADERRKISARENVLMQSAEAALAEAERARMVLFRQRPGFFARLLRTQRYKDWQQTYDPLDASKTIAMNTFASAAHARKTAAEALQFAADALSAADARLNEARAFVSSLQSKVEDHRHRLGSTFVDETFFEQGHEAWNLASPWVPEQLQHKREDLFAAAMQVHQAFAAVAAQKILHNLGALMGAMQAGAFKESEKKALLPDLWSTLFMVVPVVSTTFASVDRMLGDVPPASLGYLLVDEAGQATPQSAVGALMRVQKAIVVGDPLQIPPVVSLPDRLITGICGFFRVSPELWSAPQASVQTVADRPSPFKATFRSDAGNRQVGLPLLVHRRCQQPMFSISNRVAYDDQMVYAAGKASEGAIGRVLGKSGWFDVSGTAASKWCPEEGKRVVELLTRLAAAGVREPDVYIISPFRIVAFELRRLLSERHDVFARFGVDADHWLRDRVGTIHTFQGKEAEAVIAVLGAPMASQQGARRWAGTTPNILNVMVSRAKNRMYVVGSRTAWERVGHCQEVAARLSAHAL